MNKTELPTDITIELVPFEIPVRTQIVGTVLSNADRTPYEGKGVMRVQQKGLDFRVSKGMINKKETLIVAPWLNVRELDNQLATKRYFELCFRHINGKPLKLRVTLDTRDASQVSDALSKLPESAHCPICPACGGFLVDDTCGYCGNEIGSWADKRKKQGLALIASCALAGVAALIAGVGYPLILALTFVLGPLTGLWIIMDAARRNIQ